MRQIGAIIEHGEGHRIVPRLLADMGISKADIMVDSGAVYPVSD